MPPITGSLSVRCPARLSRCRAQSKPSKDLRSVSWNQQRRQKVMVPKKFVQNRSALSPKFRPPLLVSSDSPRISLLRPLPCVVRLPGPFAATQQREAEAPPLVCTPVTCASSSSRCAFNAQPASLTLHSPRAAHSVLQVLAEPVAAVHFLLYISGMSAH